jgi:hypothetical protein
VAAAAGIDAQQYIPVSPQNQECIFDFKAGENLVPMQDCEPSWFTGGGTAGDFDGDGWVDLFVTRLGRPDALYRNRGDGSFADVTVAVGLGECTFTNGAVFGDVDNDGDQDLLVTSVGGLQHRYYRNDGGSFVERADAVGFALRSPGGGMRSGESVTLGDYDLDGWLDVHVNEWIEPHNVPEQFDAPGPHGSRLLHNVGDGTFEDVTDTAGVSLFGLDERGIYGFSSSFIDHTGDGYPELAIAADFRSSRFFVNAGDGSFIDTTTIAGVNRESNAMGSTWGDFDGNGAPDWFVTSIAELDLECSDPVPCWKSSGNRLYGSIGPGRFDLATDYAGVRDSGWAWGTAFFDFDNDGDDDLVVVNGWPGRDLNGGFTHAAMPMQLYRNDGNGVMTEVGALLGADDDGQGRAVLPLDYDRDGDLDLFITNHAGRPVLYRNDGGNTNDWLRVRVEGTTSNRDGRGVVVEVELAGGVVRRKFVGASAHFLGEPDLVQHFGLGPAAEDVVLVRAIFPASGTIRTLSDVAPNQTITLTE